MIIDYKQKLPQFIFIKFALYLRNKINNIDHIIKLIFKIKIMENKFQINPSINNLQNLSNIGNNNSSNIKYDNNNTNIIQSNQYYSKKKNPKEMTIEELEEYIQKNRAKMNNKNFESHSLNTSFTCNYNFGISEKIDKENQNTFSVKRNNNTKDFVKQKEKDDLKLNINNRKENGNNETDNNTVSSLIQCVINNTPFIKSNQTSRTNTINNENDNYNDKQNNINNNYNNNNENKIYNNTLPLNINMELPSPTFKNISNTLTYSLQKNDNDNETNISNNNNNSIINYSQQKKINQIDDIYNYHNKEIIPNVNSNSTVNYINSLKNKIKILNEENELLKKNNINNNISNDIIKENEIYKNKILILEEDKIKYLEQFKIEKNNYEKIIIELKQNNEILKQLLEEKDKEIKSIMNKFEIERNEFLETMKSLREIIIQKENEKNILNLKNQNIVIKPNNQNNKIEYNKKNNNISQYNINNKKKQNYLASNHNNNHNNISNLKKQKSTNGLKKSDSMNQKNKIKNSNNLSYIINDNKNINKTKNKTPNKLTKVKSKSKPIKQINTGSDIKKINIKNNLNNNYTYENNNMNINYNFDTNNTNQYDTNYNSNYNKYQNINVNSMLNLAELNSLRSDISENIYTLNGKQDNNKNNLKKINEVIFYLERSIPELTRDYKNLLNKINSNLFPNDNEKMVSNLKILGKEIEDNKNQLNELKLKQQEILKTILGN